MIETYSRILQIIFVHNKKIHIVNETKSLSMSET